MMRIRVRWILPFFLKLDKICQANSPNSKPMAANSTANFDICRYRTVPYRTYGTYIGTLHTDPYVQVHFPVNVVDDVWTSDGEQIIVAFKTNYNF